MKKIFSKKDRLIDSLFVTVCAFILLSLGICVYTLPKSDFSEEENRALSDAPRFSVSSLLSGDFFTELSAFYSDNIPLRRQMISTKALCELGLGRQQNNNVIFSRDGRLADKCVYKSTDLLEQNLSAILRFGQSYGGAFICRTVPRSIDVCVGPLPLYRSEQAQRVTDAVKNAGLYSDSFACALSSDSYYKTDHHLTTEGAYTLYLSLANELGFSPYGISDFTVNQVCDDFLGSTYSKAGLIPTAYDSITLYRYVGDDKYKIVCSDSGCALHSLYDMSKLSQKDKYQVFLGGNHGLVSISTDHGSQRPKLLIIKDSFANAVIPLLARHFDLTVVDPRYCNTPISQILDSSDPDALLLLCGIDTLATNGAFKKFFR